LPGGFDVSTPACVRKTFAERLDDALVSARRTKRLGAAVVEAEILCLKLD
jgi:hypothetical protein